MVLRFGHYSFDREALELRCSGQTIDIEPQVFDVLSFLIENRERVVSKDEIIGKVWDGRAISDSALNTRMNAARKAVGDDGKAQSVIRTFPRRGFRFVAEVVEDGSAAMTATSFGSRRGKPYHHVPKIGT